MSFFPGLGGLLDDLGDAVSGLIDIDQSELDALKQELHDTAEELESDPFGDLTLHPVAFGGSEPAAQLGHQHALAHQILSDTITGVINDLRGFRSGVVTFERLVEDADDGAALDLDRKRAAVEALVDASRHSAGDQFNLESRSEHLGAPDRGGADR